MAKRTRRSIANMAQGAIASQTDDLLAQKDEIIESLKVQLAETQDNLGEAWVMLPVDQIHPMKIEISDSGQPQFIRQPRRFFEPQKIAALAESIAIDGLQEPIVVRPGQDGNYELIDGERRLRSHQIKRIPEIKAIIRYGMSHEEALQYALTTDALKEKISPLEQAIAAINLLCLRLGQSEEQIKKLLYALQNEAVGNRKQGSQPINTSEAEAVYRVLNSLGIELGAMVNSRLPLLALPDLIRQSVEAGEISPTNAILIARSPSELHEKLLGQGKGLSKRKLQNLIADLISRTIKDVDGPEDVQNGFLKTPAKLHQVSLEKLHKVSQSPFLESDKKARKLLVAAYEKLDALDRHLSELASQQNQH